MIRALFNSHQPSRLLPLLVACVASNFALQLDQSHGQKSSRDPIALTHGPMLGQPTATSIFVWGRTSDPGEFTVRYRSIVSVNHFVGQ